MCVREREEIACVFACLCILCCVSHVRQEPGFAGKKEAIGPSEVPSNYHMCRQRQGSVWGKRRNRAEEVRSHSGIPALNTGDFSKKSVILLKRKKKIYQNNPLDRKPRKYKEKSILVIHFLVFLNGRVCY